MGYLKKNVKNRNPTSYDELKKFCIEEWNKIFPRLYFKNYLKRIDKCIEIQGNRLEDYHINQIRKETTNEESGDEEYI